MGLLSQQAEATPYFWDVNGATAGYSTVVGAWNDTNAFWNTDVAGGAGTLVAVTTAADDLTIKQATTNTGSITLSGANKLASSITFASNVGPTTTITAGTITIGGTGSSSGIFQQSTGANIVATPLTLRAASTALNFSNSSTGLLTISGTVTGAATTGTQVITVGASSSGGITLSGIIANGTLGGNVGLTINSTGAGATTLSGVNTYTGGTTLTAGTLNLNTAAALGGTAGLFTINGGTINNSTAAAITLNNNAESWGGNFAFTGTSGLNLGTGAVNMTASRTLTVNGNTLTVGGVISGAGFILTKAGIGTLALSGTNTYSGGTTVSAGALSFLNTNAKPASGTQAFGPGTTLGLGVSGASAFTSTDIDNAFAGNMTGNLSGITITSTTNIGIDTTNGSFTYASSVPSTTSGLTKLGANTLTLTGANAYSGPTSIVNGTLSVPALGNAGSTSSPIGTPALVSLGSTTTTGTLSYTGAGETTDRVIDLAGTTGGGGLDNSGTGSLTFSSAVTFTGVGAKTLTVSGAQDTTFGAAVAGGISTSTKALTIAKAGAGTLLFGAPGNTINTNTATTLTIAGGIVDIGTSGLTLSNVGATVISSSANATINATGGGVLTLSSSATTNGGDIQPAAGTTLTINANISTPVTNTGFWTAQGGALELNAAGTLVLTGNNTIAGVTAITVANGTISVGNIGTNLGGTTGFLFSAATGTKLLYTGSVSETTAVPIQTSATATTAFIDQSGPSGTLTFSANWATGGIAKVVTLQGSTAGDGVMAGVISDNTTSFTTGITKAGTGTWTLSGIDTYTGPTTVNGGNLILSGAGSLSNTGVTINALGTFSPVGARTIGVTNVAGGGGRLTLNAGGTLNLADGTIGALTIQQNTSFAAGPALTLAGGAINFDVGAAADQIVVSGATTATTGSSGSNGITIVPRAGFTTGTFTLVQANAAATNTLSNANFYLASPNLVVGGNNYTLSLSGTANTEVLTIANAVTAATPSTAFWAGGTNASWSLGSAGFATTNWVTAAAGGPDTFAVPGSTTNVLFTANSATNLDTTLDANFVINSLTFTGSGSANTAGSSIAPGTGTSLTINAAALTGNALGNGINVLAGSGANTISAAVILGSSQTWTSNASTATTVSSVVSDGGGALGLTIAGAGTGGFVLSNSNTYSGPTTINGSVLSVAVLDNGGSPSGIGQSSSAATNLVFGGTGTLRYTGGSISIDRNFTINAGSTAVFDVANSGTNLTLLGGTGITTGLLTKAGPGTLTLSGANAYSGATTVNGGTLRLSGTLGATAITANNAGTIIQVNSAASLTASNAVSITAGTTLDLNGFSVTTGALTTVATATITNTGTGVGASTATTIGTPTLTDALLVSPATAAVVPALITDGATRKTQVILNNANTSTQVTGNAANTFSGGLVLATNATNGTRLTVGTVTGTPWGTGPIIIGQTAADKATIFFNTANQTIANPIVFNTGLGSDRFGIRTDVAGSVLSGPITANSDAVFSSNTAVGALSITNKLTGAGGLVLDVSQTSLVGTTGLTVTLNTAANANNYAGDTSIGRVNGTPAQNWAANLSLGAADQIPNGVGTGNVIINNNSATRTGNLRLNGFAETINGLSGNGTVDGVSGTPTFTLGDNDATATFSGIIRNTAGTLALTKIGNGTQTLSGASTYAGLTTVTAGTLSFSASANLGNAAATNGINLSGGTLQYTGAGTVGLGALRQVTVASGTTGTIEAQNGAGELQITAGGIITSGVSAATNFTKTGPGQLTVTGIQAVNLQTGSVTVSGGTLSAGLHASNTGTITVGSTGSLQLVDTSPVNLTLAGTGAGALTLNDGGHLGFELAASGTNDSINMAGANSAATNGVITLDFYALPGFGVGIGNYNLLTAPGGLSGASYVLGNAPSGFNYIINSTGTLVSLQTSVLSNRYWTNSQASGSWTTVNGGSLSNFSTDLAGAANSGEVPQTADTVIFSSSAASVGASPINTTLDAAFTIDSLRFTAQPAGATVSIAPGTGGTLTVTPVSTANGITVDSNGGAVTISAPLTAGTAQTWSVNGTGASSLTLSGNVTYTGDVTKTGAGTLTVSGPANAGSGDFTLAGGTLNANSNGALGTGTFTIGAGTTLDNGSAGLVTLTGSANVWNGNFTYTGATQSLDLGTGAVTLAGNVQATVSGQTLTVGGAVADGVNTFNLTKAGAGTLVLNGNNTYDGTTTLSTGVLTMAGNNVLSGAIIANAGTLNMSGNNTLTGAVTVNTGATANLTGNNSFGALVTVNGGTLNLNGANTGAGGVTLASGTLNLNNDAALGAGRLTLSGGTINSPTANRLTTNNNVQTWTNGATVTFTGTNTLNLGTGAVTLGADAALATFTLANNSPLPGTTTALTVGGDITAGTGGVAGVKTLVINGTNVGTTLLSGNLSAGTATGLVVTDSLAAGATLKLTGTTSVITSLNITTTGGVVDLTGGNLSLANAGTRVLLASNNATINGGTITLTSGTAGTAIAQQNYADFGATAGTLTVNSVIAGNPGIGVDYHPNSGGTVVLNGVNTYSGPSMLNCIVSVSSIGNIGVAGNLGTGANLGTNPAAIMISGGGAGTLLYTGTGEVTNKTLGISSATATSTIDMSGTGTLRFSATGDIVSNVAGAKTLALQGSTAGIGQIDQNIVNTTNGGALMSVSKLGTGKWILNGTNTYGGTTFIDNGILAMTPAAAQTLAGGFTFGAAAGNTTASTLDLTGIASTATWTGAATVQTNAAATNTIALAAGKPLTLNGGLTIGYAASAGTATTTKLTTSGAGSLAVNGTNLIVGVDGTGAVNSAWFNQATLDVRGLASFSTNVTNFNIGSGGNVVPTGDVLLSNTANTILATTLVVGSTGGANGDGTSTLTLGTGTNIINADTIQIGRGKASGPGVVKFVSQAAGSSGTVTIGNKLGTGAAAIDVGNINATGTGAGAIGTLDLRGHVATVNASTLTMGNTNNTTLGGGATGTVSFDAGTFTVATVNMAPKTAAGTGNAVATLNVGGGTFTVNTAFTLGSQASAAASIATLNLTGGTFNSNVSILQGGGATTSTINLDGGTLNMANNAIGSTANQITLNAKQGILQNLAQLNGGSTALTKSTGGSLTITGTNAYTGATSISGGILTVDSAGTLSGTSGVSVASTATFILNGTIASAMASGGLSVASGGTLKGSGSTSNAAAAVSVNGTLSPGNSPGIMTVAGPLTLGATSTYVAEIGGTTPGNGANNYDQTNAGTLTLSGGTLTVSSFNNFQNSDPNQLYFILTQGGAGTTPAGQFAGLAESQSFTLPDGFSTAQITYTADSIAGTGAGTGNDVALYNVNLVPEPASLGLLGLGLAGLLARRRRRSR